MPIDTLIQFIMSLGAIGAILAILLLAAYGWVLGLARRPYRQTPPKPEDETVHILPHEEEPETMNNGQCTMDNAQ